MRIARIELRAFHKIYCLTLKELIMEKKNKYQIRKEEARDEAIEWQYWQAEQHLSWAEVVEWADYFYKLGKRYGLLREFRENGIC